MVDRRTIRNSPHRRAAGRLVLNGGWVGWKVARVFEGYGAEEKRHVIATLITPNAGDTGRHYNGPGFGSGYHNVRLLSGVAVIRGGNNCINVHLDDIQI